MHTPSPGAVCPSMEIYGARMITGVFNLMIPATLNTTKRAPPCSHAQRKLPGPSSFRFVTTYTFPPRPPKLNLPPPSAPGNAGIDACGRSDGTAAHGINGFPFFSSASIVGSAFVHAWSERFLKPFIAASAESSNVLGMVGYCDHAECTPTNR